MLSNSKENGSITPYITLIVPAYNESIRIPDGLVKIDSYLKTLNKPYEIIVVDDGSTDNMLEAIKNISQDIDVTVVSYTPNRGKGYAVKQGVEAANGDYIAFSDADLSAPIEDLSLLISAIEKGADIAIGSRAIKGAKLEKHQPKYRELGGKGLNLFIRIFAVSGIKDTQCGFKLFKRKPAKEIFSMVFLKGWAFDVEVLYLARKLGYTVAEIPVRWSHSEGSKLSPLSAGISVIIDIIKMRLHRYSLKGS